MKLSVFLFLSVPKTTISELFLKIFLLSKLHRARFTWSHPTLTTVIARMGSPEASIPRVLSRSSSCSSFDDSYFYLNYVPLSNLPTPPLVYSNSTTRRPSQELFFPDDSLSPALRGRAPPAQYSSIKLDPQVNPSLQAQQSTLQI